MTKKFRIKKSFSCEKSYPGKCHRLPSLGPPLAIPFRKGQGGLTAFPSLAFPFGRATGSSPLTLLWPFPFGIAWECSPRERMTLITLFRFHR